MIKKAISSEIAGMAFNYLLKQQVAESLEQDISPYEEIFGTWGDRQVLKLFYIWRCFNGNFTVCFKTKWKSRRFKIN